MDYGSQVLTSKKTGIKPVSKQSRFVWSRRQIRGKVIKHLLTHWPTAITTLEHLYPHDAFTEIIEQMLREHLLNKKQSILFI
jgi:A/G-specific adenine glycosylase